MALSAALIRRRRRLPSALSGAAALLNTWANSDGGLAADFTDITSAQPYGSMKIIDGATPANNWQTTTALTPFDKLTWTGASLRMCYGSDGVLRYAPHNLISATNGVTTAPWSKTAVTATDNQTDRLGGTNAFKLVPTAAASNHYIQHSSFSVSAGGTYIIIMEVKADGYNYLGGEIHTPSGFNSIRVDLVSLTASGGGTETTFTLSALSDGWVQVKIATTLSSASVVFGPRPDYTAGYNFTGDGTSGALFGRIRYLRSPVASEDFIQTVASTAFRPRIDYDPSTLAVRGLLVEEARTNTTLYSQQLDNAAWTKSGLTVTADQIASPDGTTNADLLTASGAGGTAEIYSSVGVTAAAWTWSCYVKKGTAPWFWLDAYDAGNKKTYFNLTNGTIGTNAAGNTASITSVGNDWWRIVVTRTHAAGASYFFCGICDADGSTARTAGITAYLWGCQSELGAFASSMIPTTSASVTRAADAVTLATSSYNKSWPMSLYMKAVPGGGASLNGGGVQEYSTGYAAISVVGSSLVQTGSNGAAAGSSTSAAAVVAGTAFKAAGRLNTNSVRTCLNGTLATEDTTADAPNSARTTLYIGYDIGGAKYFNGWFQEIMILPQALADASLQTLTT